VAEDPTAELFLVDGQLKLIARGIGRLDTAQPPGLYKLMAQVGTSLSEQFIKLKARAEQPEKRVSVPRHAFLSPAPMPGTASFVAEHHDAAMKLANGPTPDGKTSSVFVMVRELPREGSKESGRPQAETPENTLADLRLQPAQGEIIDLAARAQDGAKKRAWFAAACVGVEPGVHTLLLGKIGLPLFVAKGAQTQVFMALQDYANPPAGSAASTPGATRRADLDGAAILMQRRLDLASAHCRLAELARLGLRGNRKILGEEVRQILDGKFEDPMLGIFGAHLLLGEAKPDLHLLGVVVANLRSILAAMRSPDVEALSLALSRGATDFRFADPPMLRRSWSLIVEATKRHPELVPAGGRTAALAGRLWGGATWLMWRTDDTDAAREARLNKAFDAVRGRQELFRDVLASSRQRPAQQGGSVQTAAIASSTGAGTESADDAAMLVDSLGLPRGLAESMVSRWKGGIASAASAARKKEPQGGTSSSAGS
jgi:hypothetical protein